MSCSHWVTAASQPPQPRVLMASVPYAFKAADSATLGGLPASAFVLAGSKAAADLAPAAASAATMTASAVTTTGGTTGYVSEFTAHRPSRTRPSLSREATSASVRSRPPLHWT